MRNDYELLLAKLDAFIRRYYKDRIIRGALYSIGLLALFFLAVALLEHFGHFGTGMRTALFWGYVVLAAVVLLRFIVLPLAKWMRLGRSISHEEAARIIGTHFTEVRDKLLNTLQLHGMAESDPARRELILASIGQRSQELGTVPFARAIDLRRNTRYLRYALPPLLILLGLLVAAPTLITGPTQRLIRYGSEFVPEAPFRFVVLNEQLEVPEEQDFELEVEMEGAIVPQQVDIVVDGRLVPLVKQDARRFRHRFRNVREPVDFQLAAEGFRSVTYTLNMVPDPLLLDLVMHLEYPDYIGRPDESTGNTGDATVPAGTRITWTAGTRSTERLELAFEDTTLMLRSTGADRFTASKRFLQSRSYRMTPYHGDRMGSSPLEYRVEVVPDLYPTIAVESRRDSLAPKRLFFNGVVGDDHGLRRLQFHYRFVAGGDSVPAERRQGMEELPIDGRLTRQEFYHRWELYDLTILPGDRIEHWFEVWDNDGVNGSKSTRSSVQVFSAPTLKELGMQQEAESSAMKSAMQESIQEARELQRELDELRRELLEKKDLNWQDQQKIQEVLDRQKELQQRIERSSQQMRQSQQMQQEFRQMDERLLEKQQMVQELFENVLSEEMKELYRKVQEMLDKLDKDGLEMQMEEMKLSQEDIEKELDRTMELFKQMEVEQMAEDIIERMRDLAEEQQQLADDTKEGNTPQEELQQRQEEMNKAFEELREEMDKLEEKNEELETPLSLPDTDALEEEIGEEQQKSSEQLDKKQNQKAGGSQQNAAEQMEQLAFQMESAMADGAQEQQEEDMDDLRQLLENILHLSFEQERVLGEVTVTNTKDPRFIDLSRTQRKLRDDARVVEDSLFALSKRVPQLQGIVNREMNLVNSNMDRAVGHLGEARADQREKPKAAERQQHAMTSLNNLALLLDEALQQMMQQMAAASQPGSGNCNKPGSGSGQGKKPSMAKMKAQQEALNKQLEEMRKAMEKGPNKGEKPGEKNPGGMGMPGMSQQLAQMAAQQAALRKEMQRLGQELNKDGSGAGNELNKLAEEMEETERDIVNKRIDRATIQRQQDIMVRLLEHEKAERERELDEQRSSNEGRDLPKEDPARFFEYQRQKAREAELLRTVPPGLKPYYRDRVNEYFGTFGRP
jgi:hypothetical protein